MKYWKSFVYILCGSILVVPFYSTFDDSLDHMSGEWKNHYVLNTFDYAVVIIPIILFLILIPRLENRKFKRILILLTLLLAGMTSWQAYLAAFAINPDFMPTDGILLLLILFPTVVIDAFVEWNYDKRILHTN